MASALPESPRSDCATPYTVPRGRAILDIRLPDGNYVAAAALSSQEDWAVPFRNVNSSESQVRFAGDVGGTKHFWIPLSVAPPLCNGTHLAEGVDLVAAGEEIIVDAETAQTWRIASVRPEGLPHVPIRHEQLGEFAKRIRDYQSMREEGTPKGSPIEAPAHTLVEREGETTDLAPAEEMSPIIPDVDIDRAKDTHALAGALKWCGLTIPEDLESRPLAEVRAIAKQLTRSPEAHAAAADARAYDETVASKRKEEGLFLSFALHSEKGVRLDNAKVGKYVRDRLHTLNFNKTLYIYDDATGFYRENAGHTEALIQEIAEAVGFDGSISTAKREIMSYVRDHNINDGYPFNNAPNALPVANGVLIFDWDENTVHLEPYSPEYKFTLKLPVVYDPSISWEPFHRSVISKYIDDEEAIAIYQIPAQAILQYLGYGPYKRAYVLEGPPHSGKTTVLEWWLNALFGAQNISGVSLQQMGMDRFCKGAMEGKIINRYDDMSDVPLQNVGPFKAYTGGFSHEIEKKHANSYAGRITAVNVFSCNTIPSVPDAVLFDPAFWDRWVYLRFSNCFEVVPDFYRTYMTPEMVSGSFNRILQLVFQIREGGRLIIAPDPGEVKETWMTSADPFARFVKENMTPSSNACYFKKEAFFRAFLKWCSENGIPTRKIPSSISGFTRMIFSAEFTTKQRREGKTREWVFVARYGWRPDSSYGRMCESDGKLGV
jgi:putative DNA primase/helicase